MVEYLGGLFASRGETAFLVGGVVRDALAGRDTSDVDVAVAGDTVAIGDEVVAALGGTAVLMDAARRIVRVVPASRDSGAVLDLSPLRGSIEQDLALRDFTVDAMAIPIADSIHYGDTVVDPHGGRSDLREGVVRAVSEAVFVDDPLRLMRAPRLAAQLGFTIEDGTAQAIKRHAHLIEEVSAERVKDELLKLIAEPDATRSLRLLDDLGLLCRVLPELAEARGVTQPKEHHWPVLDHCIETAGQVERLIQDEDRGPEDFVLELAPRFRDMPGYFGQDAGDEHTRLTMLKLAGLLHDVGKPATRTVEDTGRIRFLGHHETGSEMTESALDRLRLSRRGVDAVSKMVKYHLRPGQMAQTGELPTRRAIYRYYRDVGDVAIDTLYLNLADYLAARGPMLQRQEWADCCRVAGHILQGFEPTVQRNLPGLIDGHDLMRAFDIAPGPEIGSLLELVREAQAVGGVATRDEALSLVESSLSDGGRSA
jgi:poly(A) polymerase